MPYTDYEKAQKQGVKALRAAIIKGENEYLPVLDEILEGVDIVGEQPLGVYDIPLERVVGTSTQGRTYAFANNFMPILDLKTEFGAKWTALCDSQIEEGIHEPIKVYEYMANYYVVEGNKRVSVLKYFEASTIPAVVTRKVPKLTDDLQVKIYYEYMDCFKLTGINYLWFSQEGCFKRLLELTSEDPEAVWTDDQRKDFGSFNHRFNLAIKSVGAQKLHMMISEALLVFIDIYGYEEVKDLSEAEIKAKINTLWEEFAAAASGRELTLQMEPAKQGRKNLIDYFFSPSQKKITVGFIFDKDPKDSDWLYAHELGRLYLEEHHPDTIKTIEAHNLNDESEITTAIDGMIAEGASIIFTTSSRMEAVSLKAAANNPKVTILNCSIETRHRVMRTYYARLYEVKFLSGMIAGALTKSGRIGYLADYPIIGMPANINAFALGARMMNPEAKVFLEWTKIKGSSRELAIEHFKRHEVHFISDQDMIKPNEEGRLYGLYHLDNDGLSNIASPMYNWGVFYDKLIDSIKSGTYQQEDDKDEKAINYWWGLSAGVLDIILSKKLPDGTRQLVDLMKELIVEGRFNPFSGTFRSQDGLIRSNDDKEGLTPEEILDMNYLVENVVGSIPEKDMLDDAARAIVDIKGVE